MSSPSADATRRGKLGERRRDDGLAVVYTSDLARAEDTAAIAFAGTSIPVHSDSRLRECNYGDLNGGPVEAVGPSSATTSTWRSRAARATATWSSAHVPSWTTSSSATTASASS